LNRCDELQRSCIYVLAVCVNYEFHEMRGLGVNNESSGLGDAV
jgi:hypothetical protein